MARKLAITVRHLEGLGITEISTPENGDIAAALRTVANYLDTHPNATLLAINNNFSAAHNEECYLTAVFDGTDDDHITY